MPDPSPNLNGDQGPRMHPDSHLMPHACHCSHIAAPMKPPTPAFVPTPQTLCPLPMRVTALPFHTRTLVRIRPPGPENVAPDTHSSKVIWPHGYKGPAAHVPGTVSAVEWHSCPHKSLVVSWLLQIQAHFMLDQLWPVLGPFGAMVCRLESTLGTLGRSPASIFEHVSRG